MKHVAKYYAGPQAWTDTRGYIKIYLKEIAWVYVNWVYLAQVRYLW